MISCLREVIRRVEKTNNSAFSFMRAIKTMLLYMSVYIEILHIKEDVSDSTTKQKK